MGGFLYFLAEAVRFELTNGFPRRQFSRLLPSTTRPRFLSANIIHASLCHGQSVQPPYSTSSQFSRNPISKRAAGSGAAYR